MKRNIFRIKHKNVKSRVQDEIELEPNEGDEGDEMLSGFS